MTATSCKTLLVLSVSYALFCFLNLLNAQNTISSHICLQSHWFYTLKNSSHKFASSTLHDQIHLASSKLIEISLVELRCFWLDELEVCGSNESMPWKKPGCLGWGSSTSLSNINTADAMVGLSSGCCCAHNKLTWMHLNISDTLHVSSMFLSINSRTLPSLHSIHAWNSQLAYQSSNLDWV